MKNKKNTLEALAKKRKVLKQSLPPVDKIIRGTFKKRYIECGKLNCRCHKEGGHGPYYYLTINYPGGETKCVKIPRNDVREVQRWVRNYKKTKRVLERISNLNLKCIEYKKKQH